MTIVYQDDAIEPENRDVIKKIRDSGLFERMADRLTAAVTLPHDLQVVVTDDLPKAVDDPNTVRIKVWPRRYPLLCKGARLGMIPPLKILGGRLDRFESHLR